MYACFYESPHACSRQPQCVPTWWLLRLYSAVSAVGLVSLKPLGKYFPTLFRLPNGCHPPPPPILHLLSPASGSVLTCSFSRRQVFHARPAYLSTTPQNTLRRSRIPPILRSRQANAELRGATAYRYITCVLSVARRVMISRARGSRPAIGR
jgi:hypothetical protein